MKIRVYNNSHLTLFTSELCLLKFKKSNIKFEYTFKESQSVPELLAMNVRITQ